MKGEEEKRRGERTEAGTCRRQARVKSVSTSHMHMNSDVGQAASPRGQGEARASSKQAGARASMQVQGQGASPSDQMPQGVFYATMSQKKICKIRKHGK